MHEAVEEACGYLVERVRREAPRSWLQGPRRPALPVPEGAPDLLRLFASREIYRLPRSVAEALLAWAAGERRVEVWRALPSPREVLAMQARGVRCVSLLADVEVPEGEIAGLPRAHAYGSGGLAFAVHDLCHLEKFFAPAHHREQVGFFAALDRAMGDPRLAALDARLDEEWVKGREDVMADMNGASVFLYVVLRSKLKLAVRRQAARSRGGEVRRGPLDAMEADLYEEALGVLIEAMGITGAAREAARALTSRADAEAAAPVLAGFFAERTAR